MSEIFFSYRSADSAIAERILERLASRYGRDNVKRDLRALPRELQELRTLVESTLEKIDVFVAIIGPTWARTRGGAHRLDDPRDIIHLELAEALARGIPIIPVLVRGTTTLSTEDLPDDLKTLTQRQTLSFGGDETYRSDMIKLHRRLADAFLAKQEASRRVSQRDEAMPSPERKDELNETARRRVEEGRAPFEGVRIHTLSSCPLKD
jgi:hypothetical protein